ncbi:MAG: S41 family peptidase [Candidatus Pacebacteria bacterium]|jgi:carboxyl-terminal processing protease|nr:S41 family peptidase [Candidatus Paceibacterota bacterium]MDP7159140.1 S41 family peptidase [Candidatus Paceibacterota bacterium]MDP7368091.1 S41 family peptidase [Candidatus Paceibacterota bacterium]MDP7466025.1 S41 family peptidase [Candidatus Paceibacterota bacterium]MDP7648293.1 S41 family peptidase [Candidatus Paceibacterota bacterium]|tara:strand:+ start:1251 stop:2480 length:1230 start_codon:yes stop_codon:yes gene_type:complete
MKFFSQNSVFTIVVIILLVVAAFFSGLFVGKENDTEISTSSISILNGGTLQPSVVDFSPLWKAWNAINEKFVPATTTDPVTDEDKLYGTIQGLARSLNDPYTVFLPPEDSEIFEDDIRGNFEGVGMEIGIRDNILTVIAPLKDNPAERAGIRAGDKVIKIDDTTTEGMTIDKAVKLIRGEGGTTVNLTILREGESELLEISVVRDVIQIPTIETELTEDGVFVIKLFNFSAISPNLFREVLREFVELGTDKMLLDLRGNPGGFLEAAIDIASWYLPTGKVVVTEDFGENGKPRIHRSKGYNIFNENLKMAILINQGSASASEILAGALQQHGKATLVGDRTFGKGSVQELVRITPNTSLKVTIARWLTPNGASISDGGLTPDVEVKFTTEDFEAGEDPQFDRVIEILTK